MNEKIVGVVAVVLVLVGGWYLLQKAPESTLPTDQSSTTESPAPSTATAPAGVVVTYSDQGFSPKDVSVPVGTTVTFVNQSTGNLWVASAMHPTHSVYSGSSLSQHCPDTTNSTFDACAAIGPGNSYSFTFEKEGVWKYHNHVSTSQFGSVVVTSAASASVNVSL